MSKLSPTERTTLLDTAGSEVYGMYVRLKAPDRRAACRYIRVAMGRMRRGEYGSREEFLAEAVATLQPKARDWSSFLEFLTGVADLFAKVFPLFIK